MHVPFPPEAEAAAARHGLSPAMAFGLGEGLNLYYSRRLHGPSPHRLHVLPSTFAERVAARAARPRAEAVREALHDNALAVLVCTGDWHGLDAIEKWAEELPRWPLHEGWRDSATRFADLIEASDGLYRRSYARFLDEAGPIEGVGAARPLLDEIATGWLAIAGPLRAGEQLERLGRRLLRQAALESRFWGMIHSALSAEGAAPDRSP